MSSLMESLGLPEDYDCSENADSQLACKSSDPHLYYRESDSKAPEWFHTFQDENLADQYCCCSPWEREMNDMELMQSQSRYTYYKKGLRLCTSCDMRSNDFDYIRDNSCVCPLRKKRLNEYSQISTSPYTLLGLCGLCNLPFLC